MTEACAHVLGCPFFNDRMTTMPAMSELYKQRYCLSDYTQCARHRLGQACGREQVPADLHPNEQDRATQLIASA